MVSLPPTQPKCSFSTDSKLRSFDMTMPKVLLVMVLTVFSTPVLDQDLPSQVEGLQLAGATSEGLRSPVLSNVVVQLQASLASVLNTAPVSTSLSGESIARKLIATAVARGQRTMRQSHAARLR